MQQMHDQYWHSTAGAPSADPFVRPHRRARRHVRAYAPGWPDLLTLLDALQPVGLARVVLDVASLWPQLGALATVEPMAALQVLERDGYRELGTVLAVDGQGHDGDHAVRLTIKHDSGQVDEGQRAGGNHTVRAPGSDEEVSIEVRPSRCFRRRPRPERGRRQSTRARRQLGSGDRYARAAPDPTAGRTLSPAQAAGVAEESGGRCTAAILRLVSRL